MINSLNDEDVRVTDRLTLPRQRLKGFQYARIDQLILDTLRNYATALNFAYVAYDIP